MPKPTQRLFILAKDLTSAIRAVNKADPSLVAGVKVAEDLKLPKIMKNPIIHEHPDFEEVRILQVDLPRSTMEFDHPGKRLERGVIEDWKRLNQERKASIFPNVGRRQLSSEGVMSAELFKDLAKQGKVKILQQKPHKIKEFEFPASDEESYLPSYIRRFSQANVPDHILFRKIRDTVNVLDDINARNVLKPQEQVLKKAWEPFGDFRDFADTIVKEDYNISRMNNLNIIEKADQALSDAIRNVSERILPISEPRKRGINKNIVYRRIFTPKKDS